MVSIFWRGLLRDLKWRMTRFGALEGKVKDALLSVLGSWQRSFGSPRLQAAVMQIFGCN
jgi:hypothetical protein